jgi:hypothetical protein
MRRQVVMSLASARGGERLESSTYEASIHRECSAQ